jgi:glycosyltransferase involved in cell wall biosynthesis
MDPVPIKGDHSIVRKLGSHARSIMSREPFVFHEYSDHRFGKELRDTLTRARPHLIHFDSLDLYRWLPLLPNVPMTCTHHSIESDLLRLQADRFRNRAVRAYINHQASLLEKIERRLCPDFDLNVMMSDLDAQRLRALAPAVATTVIPNGVDTDFFQPASADVLAGRVIFLGPTYMFPNRDAVDFFLSGPWPAIREHCPEATLHLVGKNSAEEKARFESRPGVIANGHVPDVRPHLAAAAVSIVPIRVGGGTRLKILDSWAMGKAVVSTTVGCEGLDTRDGHNILIRDDPTDFANAVVQVLRDPQLRNQLGTQGRKTVEDLYGWPVVGKKLTGQYEELISAAPASGPFHKAAEMLG